MTSLDHKIRKTMKFLGISILQSAAFIRFRRQTIHHHIIKICMRLCINNEKQGTTDLIVSRKRLSSLYRVGCKISSSPQVHRAAIGACVMLPIRGPPHGPYGGRRAPALDRRPGRRRATTSPAGHTILCC